MLTIVLAIAQMFEIVLVILEALHISLNVLKLQIVIYVKFLISISKSYHLW